MKLSLNAFILYFLMPLYAFSQASESIDSLTIYNTPHVKVKPELHYSIGSNFTFIPRYGSVTGLNVSSFLSYPVTPKLSVEGGLIAGRYYPALKNVFPEPGLSNSFNTLSVFGSASYKLSQRLTLYGTGIKQLAGSIPLYNLPSSSFSFGSTLNFGNFSIGAEIRMTDWNNYYSPSPFGGNRSIFPSYPW